MLSEDKKKISHLTFQIFGKQETETFFPYNSPSAIVSKSKKFPFNKIESLFVNVSVYDDWRLYRGLGLTFSYI